MRGAGFDKEAYCNDTDIFKSDRRRCVLAGLIAAVSSSANAASGTACDRIVSAEGRATNVEGSDDFKKYNGHVPANLARLRAISAWQGRVADQFPRL